ncbi:hypothetical protein GUK30_32690 [Rhizobium leguminosarum]|uniref:IS1/IS1595 family N-terminal zinc-binding domain-containing protein n=1 Tax=Rhizobium ruizarguesonis TaxID=2081791 RepID=UPI0013BFC652|nr:hypothetical protein [Rhizobium ruizarguesonis]
MRMPMVRELVHCPDCGSDDCVKNGKPRGDQRFRCTRCKTNFTPMPKNRAHRAHKFEQARRRLNGEALLPGWSVASVDRWVSEAQEHFDWFLRHIADEGVRAYEHIAHSARPNMASVKMHPGRAIIDGAYDAYMHALRRDPTIHLSLEDFLKLHEHISKAGWPELRIHLRAYLLTDGNESGWQFAEPRDHLGVASKREERTRIRRSSARPMLL